MLVRERGRLRKFIHCALLGPVPWSRISGSSRPRPDYRLTTLGGGVILT